MVVLFSRLLQIQT